MQFRTFFRALALMPLDALYLLALMIKQSFENPRVLGSIPRPGTILLKGLLLQAFFSSI
jgi:hypothetical protein